MESVLLKKRFGANTLKPTIIESYTTQEISDQILLSKFSNYLTELQSEDCFINLFTVKIDEDTKQLIEHTIKGRNIVAKKNNLPSYMLRSNQNSIDVKSVAAEIPMSFILREMNRGNKCKLSSPELNTITPNRDKPDYIITHRGKELLFDMKSQCKSKSVNINKKAHDRAFMQGLKFYIVGVINSDKIEELSTVTYYYLSVDYMLKNARFVNDDFYCLKDHKNDYFSIDIKDIKKSPFYKG